jgi:hypothetical protein
VVVVQGFVVVLHAQLGQQPGPQRCEPGVTRGPALPEVDVEVGRHDAVVSVEMRMTCAGAAQTSVVDSAIHQKLKPTSCASAPMPT